MKTTLASALRLTALAATLTFATAGVSAKENHSSDRAAQLLAVNSSVPVTNAGPYVERGTLLIQVAVKLGRPTAKLADGTWLYPNYTVENSAAHGTLVVRFSPAGRVTDLSLVTPSAATAMLGQKKSSEKILVADRR